MPILLELIDAETKAPAEIDGISFAATLLGKPQPERPFLYREFSGYGGQQAVWLGKKWKGTRQNLLRKKTDPLQIELYDLETDAGETTDVAEQNPEITARIRDIMKNQHVPSDVFQIPAIDRS